MWPARVSGRIGAGPRPALATAVLDPQQLLLLGVELLLGQDALVDECLELCELGGDIVRAGAPAGAAAAGVGACWAAICACMSAICACISAICCWSGCLLLVRGRLLLGRGLLLGASIDRIHGR